MDDNKDNLINNDSKLEFSNQSSDIDNIVNQVEFTLKYSCLVVALFLSSYLIASQIIRSNYNNNGLNPSSLSKNNTNNQYKESQQEINNDYYVIFKNTEPSIKQIELFIAKNQHKLSQSDLDKIEELRLRRITELMAKKYINIAE